MHKHNNSVYVLNTMKIITSLLRKIMPKDPPTPAGRWRIVNCNKQMNQRIDLSNEDHCGPCGQYALEKGRSVPESIPIIRKP